MDKISYRIINKSRLICCDRESENQVDFPWPIAEILDCGNALVVRVEPRLGANDNENIYGVDGHAAILWQVPRQQYAYDDSPFTGMTRIENYVRLFNWDGTELLIDPMTGEVIEETFGK